MKELLKKAFEAGKDRQYYIGWKLDCGGGERKPDFEEWYEMNKGEAFALQNTIGKNTDNEPVSVNEPINRTCATCLNYGLGLDTTPCNVCFDYLELPAWEAKEREIK
jgi:hypothetical protein